MCCLLFASFGVCCLFARLNCCVGFDICLVFVNVLIVCLFDVCLALWDGLVYVDCVYLVAYCCLILDVVFCNSVAFSLLCVICDLFYCLVILLSVYWFCMCDFWFGLVCWCLLIGLLTVCCCATVVCGCFCCL